MKSSRLLALSTFVLVSLGSVSSPVSAEVVTIQCDGTIYRIDYDSNRVARRGPTGLYDESFSAQITTTQIKFRETFAGTYTWLDVVLDRVTGKYSSSNDRGSNSGDCRQVSDAPKF